MDANKLAKLRAIGYQIRPTCGMCRHSTSRAGSHFGTCSFHAYEHRKHTRSPRNLSVHISGYCDSFEAHGASQELLGPFTEFLEDDRP